MGEGDDGGVAVGLQLAHHIVRHAGHQPGLVGLEAGGVLLPRVADQYLVAQGRGHGRQVLGELPGADDDEPPTRAVVGDEVGVAQRQFVGAAGDLQVHLAGGQREAAPHPLPGLQLLQQLVQPGAVLHRLQHQLDQAAAGQAEAVGGVGVDAVTHYLRHARGERPRLGLGDEVVLNAAARDAAGHQAVAAYGHAGARGARGRTPGAGDGA